MNGSRKKGLTIIIPCLNEEETIQFCVEEAMAALKKHKIPGEVLVVDNGSDDDSASIALSSGARVVVEQSRGYGSAYSAGVSNAIYQYCLKGDADGSYDFNQISLLYDKLLEDKWEIVIGSRFKGQIMPGAMPFLHRYFGTPALTYLVNYLFKSKLSDINSGMRAFSVQTMLDLNLKCKGMEFASEMLIKALKKKMRIVEVPISLRKDKRNKKPHLKTFRDGWRHLSFILLMSPLQIYFYPGVISIFLGMVFSFFFLIKDYLYLKNKFDLDLLSIFGITTFAYSQSLIILGEILILFSYVSKSLFINKNIDLPSRIFSKLKKMLSFNNIVLISGVGIMLSIVFILYTVCKLYAKYTVNSFSPFYTKLGIFSFTVFIFFSISVFTSFLISAVEN